MKDAARQIDYFNQYTFAEIAVRYAKIHDFGNVLTLTDGFQDSRILAAVMVRIAEQCLADGLSEQAFDALCKALLAARHIKDILSESQALSSIAQGYARAGKYAEAFLIARSIKDASYETAALNRLSGEYMVHQKKRKATEILTQAMSAAQTIVSPVPRAEALVSVAVQYSHAGAPLTAKKILTDTLKLSETIDDATRRIDIASRVANGYFHAQDKAKALNLLSKTQRVANMLSHPMERTDSLIHLASEYALIAGAVQASDMLATAMSGVQAIEETYPRTMASIRLSDIYIRNNDQVKAFRILSRAYREALNIKRDVYRARALSGIAMDCAKIGKYRRAVEITKQISGYDIEILEKTAMDYANAGYQQQAESILSQVSKIIDKNKNDSSKARALITLARRYTEIREDDKAVAVLDQIPPLVRSLADRTRQSDLLVGVVDVYLSAHHYHKAYQAAMLMEKGDQKLNAFSMIALNYNDFGKSSDKKSKYFLHDIIQEFD